MKHATVRAFDIPGAWFRTLEEIWRNGDDYQVGYGSTGRHDKICLYGMD